MFKKDYLPLFLHMDDRFSAHVMDNNIIGVEKYGNISESSPYRAYNILLKCYQSNLFKDFISTDLKPFFTNQTPLEINP